MSTDRWVVVVRRGPPGLMVVVPPVGRGAPPLGDVLVLDEPLVVVVVMVRLVVVAVCARCLWLALCLDAAAFVLVVVLLVVVLLVL